MKIKNNFFENISKAKKIIETDSYKKVFNLEELDFSYLKGKGIVYFIFVTSKDGNSELKYIGKSRGHLFKQRMINHFHHSHKKTGTKRRK